MKLFCTLFFLIGFSVVSTGQDVNMIIQINDEIVEGALSNMYLKFKSLSKPERISVGYVPGRLSIDSSTWQKMTSDTTSFTLYFSYNTFHKDKHDIEEFYVELNKRKLNQPYLILNIYDFRDKKYKNWYQWHTDKSFLTELRFPGSGIYIRNGKK